MNTSSGDDEQSLAKRFQKVDRSQWADLAKAALNGKPIERLDWKTDDGLIVSPIFENAKDVKRIVSRAGSQPWEIMQRVDHPDAEMANSLLMEDLEGGANGLVLTIAGGMHARGFGIPIDALETVLSGVVLDAVAFRIEGGTLSIDAAEAVAGVFKNRTVLPGEIKCSFGLDPVGYAANGNPDELDIEVAADCVEKLKDQGFSGPFFEADGRIWHDAGAGEVQELAAVLATGVTYLRCLEARGWTLENAANAVGFTLVTDASQFLSLAKMRALRLLWNQVAEACGAKFESLRLHSETSWRMMTRQDPNVNMLRTTVAGFAAGAGGVQSLCILPYTLAEGLPNSHARRIARNSHTLLIEESNIHKVEDPGLGSGYIESLTLELAKAAWSEFQKMEQAGGLITCLESGLLYDQITNTQTARDLKAATRKIQITGTSAFPNLDEAKANVLNVPVIPQTEINDPVAEINSFVPVRLSEPWENLRERAVKPILPGGRRSSIFLANLGQRKDYAARSAWSQTAFETGGFAVLQSNGFEDLKSLQNVFVQSGNNVVCICSSDTVYDEIAVEAARLLRQAGAAKIIIAGRGGALTDDLKAAGVGTFLYDGCNLLNILNECHNVVDMGAKS